MGRRRHSSHSGRHKPTPPVPAVAEPTTRLSFSAPDRVAVALLVAFLAAMAWVALAVHRVPLYQVETDLLGEYVPAARDLLRGVIDPSRYTSKGVGYPLLLAIAGAACRGDFYLAARLLDLAAAAAIAATCYLLWRSLFSPGVALAALVGLFTNQPFVQASIEAGTDLPAMAIAFGSMACLAVGLRSGPRPPGGRHRHGALLFVAGVLAGGAVITRDNDAFLVFAAAVALLARPRRLESLIAYALGCGLPLAAWAAAGGGVPVVHPGTQNALNMAYEFYGGDSRDVFWSTAAPQFRSLLDVVRFDPARFAAHLVHNLATHWIQDVRLLLSPWIGVPAVAGVLLGAWRRPGGVAITTHFALAYGTLATVFYVPRFSLILVPFYLSAAAWLVLECVPRFGRAAARPRPPARWVHAVRAAAWVALIVPAARIAASGERDRLAGAPVETQWAGETLRRLGPDSAAVMASKPHVAYFARMRYVPLPVVGSYAELLAAGSQTQARYLFYSAPETDRCPQLLALVDPGVPIPGLQAVDRRAGPDRHYYALYRFTGERVAPEELQRATVAAARHFMARHPDDLLALASLSDQLIQSGQPREALAALEPAAERLPQNAPVARFQALANLELGQPDSAARAIGRILGSPATTAWDWGLMGRIALMLGRAEEARDAYRRALALDPTRRELRGELAVADSLARTPSRAVVPGPRGDRGGLGNRPGSQ